MAYLASLLLKVVLLIVGLAVAASNLLFSIFTSSVA